MSENKKRFKINLPKISKQELWVFMKPTLILVAVMASCAIVLSGIYALTNGFAEKYEQRILSAAMEKVLPAERYDVIEFDFEEANRIESMHSAVNGGAISGYCIETTEEGIDGEMRLVVGIDAESKITKVEIISMKESEGVGKKVAEESYLSQFEGKSGTLTAVKSTVRGESDISIISGATVSSEAVCRAVNHALAAVSQLKAKEAVSQ